MRTAILFGLLCIAESIGKQTGYRLIKDAGLFAFAILFFCILLDFADFLTQH